MEKHNWQKVVLQRHTKQPSPRWGHSSIVIGQQIVCFGGYADSNYMNDLWSFNSNSMIWTQYSTFGSIPTVRSNCTMHFDQKNQKVIVFGGGGPNKKRFNTLNVLDWKTKEWSWIVPKVHENAPWQRTYHSSQILYPYLIVFGGEGVTDLDDLWLFNLETGIWSQVTIDNSTMKPCARRFHSSVIIGNRFYVIAGCHGKYRCLSDVYSIDLTHVLETGKTDQLVWKQQKLQGSSFLSRWGHSSTVFEGRIYIFGGRFSSDLQDILVIDPVKHTIKTMKITGECPKARRRHSAVLLGSCMVVFGGFNGEYFNDLHYINVFQRRVKQQADGSSRDELLEEWVNKKFMSDYELRSVEGRTVYVHQGLIADRFRSSQDMRNCLNYLQNRQSFQYLLQIMAALYTGVGQLSEDMVQQYNIVLYDSCLERDCALKRLIDPNTVQSCVLMKTRGVSVATITLEPQRYSQYVDTFTNSRYHDLVLVLNQQYCLSVNKSLLAVNSKYFTYLLAHWQLPQLQIQLDPSLFDVRIFQVLINYLQNDCLVVVEGLDERCWIFLYQLAEYFSLERLMNACELQLITKLDHSNCESLLQYSLANNLSMLSVHSAEILFKNLLQRGDESYVKLLKQKILKNNKERLLSQIIQLLRFDLLQIEMRKERWRSQSMKVQVGCENCEKENEDLA